MGDSRKVRQLFRRISAVAFVPPGPPLLFPSISALIVFAVGGLTSDLRIPRAATRLWVRSLREKGNGMDTKGYIDPERDAFEMFKALPRDTPIQMLNMLRFKDHASYPDGRPATGAEAYTAYGRESGPIFRRVGGKIIWRGTPELMLIGPAVKRGDDAWDAVFVAYYPTASAFLEMVTDPEYQKAVVHRQAAVADSRLLRCGLAEDGNGF